MNLIWLILLASHLLRTIPIFSYFFLVFFFIEFLHKARTIFMPFTNIRFVRASHRIHHFQSTNFILFLLFTASLFPIFFLLSIFSFVFFFVSALLFPILYSICDKCVSAQCTLSRYKIKVTVYGSYT